MLKCSRLNVLIFTGLLSGCGLASGPSVSGLDEAWNAANDPGNFVSAAENALNALPQSGKANGPAWSGDYWPTYRGGIAQRWQAAELEAKAGYDILDAAALRGRDLSGLSPAEKYDIYAGDYSFTLTKLERSRTAVLATIPNRPEYNGSTIPTWRGLCHGWAPASVAHAEPKPVKLKNRDGIEVSFGSADIKALLTYVYHEGQGSESQLIGSRCEVNLASLRSQLNQGLISREQYDREVESANCRDTNAGSFHLALANEIGRKKKSFIADVTRDQEVWNQAVVAYDSKFETVLKQASAGAAPGTAYEVEVTTNMRYIIEIDSSWQANGNEGIYRTASYRYRLELDAGQRIIGGTWLSEMRPDFLWRVSRPQVSSRLRFLPELFQASTGRPLSADESNGGGSQPMPSPSPAPPTVPPVVRPPVITPPTIPPVVTPPTSPSPGRLTQPVHRPQPSHRN